MRLEVNHITDHTTSMYLVRLLEMPHKTSSALKLLPTELTVELWRIGLPTADIVVLHTIHSSALEITVLCMVTRMCMYEHNYSQCMCIMHLL